MTYIHRRKKSLARREGQICSKCGCGLRLLGEIRDGRRTAFVHHLKSKSDGGCNRVENLCLVCKVCHKNIHKVAG